jgi:peptidoglycan/LPS O-acetylase OafA/YrhL
VEEQFYLVWPALLILSRRASPRGLTLILLLLITASLTADQIWLSKDVLAAFYFTPLRAWEPLVGALLAAGWIAPSRSALVRQGLGLAGLAAILGSMALLRPDTPFPGLAALPACLGAALVLQAGRGGSSAPSLAGQLLSSAPLVALGTASYSLYLWHWPVLTFLRLGLSPSAPWWSVTGPAVRRDARRYRPDRLVGFGPGRRRRPARPGAWRGGGSHGGRA